GQKDVQYQYTAKAVSTDPAAVVRYSANAYNQLGAMVVEQFSIDSVSGQILWTPVLKASYKLMIVARSSKGGTAKQEFTVTVSGGNGVMQGKISDKANVGIPNVIVELYKSENNSSLFYVYSAKTDANGNYRVNRIDPGNYKVRANSPSMKYQSAWYDTAREVSQAKIVNVPDSSMGVTQVSMKLRDGFPPVSFKTISGTVTDTAGFAIDDAETRVTFVRVEFALNIAGGAGGGLENFRKYFDVNRHGDYRMEGNSEFVFKAKVDSLGKYSVLLPPGGYIAFARANGYAAEYYNEQSSILSAQAIRVLADTTGINFTLSPLPPVALGAISGSVQDTLNDIPVASRVIAFRDGWRFNDLHKIGKVYVTDTDSLGAYTFQDVLPGNYVVMALPLGNYAPAFYADDSLSFRWKHATKIAVNGNTIDNINIYVRPLGTSASGYTSIVGSVSLSGGLTGGSLRAGAVVYAYRNNEIAGYSFTNAEGQYMISGLAPGQYSVFVDKAGYDESSVASVSASYDLLGNPQSGSANFTLNSVLGVNVVSTVVPELFTLEQNYPNPFNPSTTIRFALPAAAQTVLKVYNVVGQEVATLVNEYREAGTFEATFDASKLSSGIYFYALKAGDHTQARKMVLVK
nr:carboxypeptidase regulatory-like domain-containing protein [Bacteroidota bacterium]